ncbi:hypothetical protein CR513_38310, partial [Mucuna pruriens]
MKPSPQFSNRVIDANIFTIGFLLKLEPTYMLHVEGPLRRKLLMMPLKLLKTQTSNNHQCSTDDRQMINRFLETFKLHFKLNLGSFTIPSIIDNSYFEKELCNLGASINLMPFALVDIFVTHPLGIVEDVLMKVDKFIFFANFVVLNMDEDMEVSTILGRLFLNTLDVDVVDVVILNNPLNSRMIDLLEKFLLCKEY